ncbi:hypothetical protein [Microseira sp. BLCC-F43]|uniref:hypothetical protein n=1 Tax=Microseira sp. BLCC-F43 TaxID=3153602 RepID=UPI0035B84BB3
MRSCCLAADQEDAPDGEMGRWGDGETHQMGRWGDGETHQMGRWGDGETGRWGDAPDAPDAPDALSDHSQDLCTWSSSPPEFIRG